MNTLLAKILHPASAAKPTDLPNEGTVMINIGRRLRRGTQALALAAALAGGTVALTSAQPAFAASTWTQANCGWQLVTGYLYPYKQTTVWLPQVTGFYSTYQYVTLRVQFVYGTGGSLTYDFYTSARSGAWTKYWTSSSDGGTYDHVFDTLGNSGFASGAASSPNTYVYVTAWWWSGSRIVGGPVSQQALNYKSSTPAVCNSGTNWAAF